ncbi:hypothetical protein EVAR_43393_1 [Eumeta japonica]|uniref:Uncharacterized protein n=1 Tax=Eumeta variegata TaxID=151549 RepID=A0A4C1WUF9_EUMVA|nr:hypothetical protein EVAR_43393_1 [Eumeta japonica]
MAEYKFGNRKSGYRPARRCAAPHQLPMHTAPPRSCTEPPCCRFYGRADLNGFDASTDWIFEELSANRMKSHTSRRQRDSFNRCSAESKRRTIVGRGRSE